MTDLLTNTTGTPIAFIAGMVVGALLWHGVTSLRSRRMLLETTPPMLWDIHSLLNAMNKIALASERGRLVEPSLVYLLSDYLLHGALIQREDGWADRGALENWLLAHVRVVADHRGQTTLPAVGVQLQESVRRVHTHQLLRHVLWLMQKVPTINRIQVAMPTMKNEGRMITLRIEVEGDPAEFDKLLEGGSPSSRFWRMDSGQCICELRVPFEPAPPA